MTGVVVGDPILLGLNCQKHRIMAYGLSIRSHGSLQWCWENEALLNRLLETLCPKPDTFLEFVSSLLVKELIEMVITCLILHQQYTNYVQWPVDSHSSDCEQPRAVRLKSILGCFFTLLKEVFFDIWWFKIYIQTGSTRHKCIHLAQL